MDLEKRCVIGCGLASNRPFQPVIPLDSFEASLLLTNIFSVLLTGDALETAALVCVKAQEDVHFERFYSQLRPYYFDFDLAESARENLVVSLYLIYLLTKGRISDFHTHLEILPPKMRNHALIKFSVDLERDMNEGLYNRVWNACNALPDPAFRHFAENLSDATRNDIAKCIEAAYDTLSVSEVLRLLHYTSSDSGKFQAFATSEERGWSIEGQTVNFKQGQLSSLDLGATELINQSLAYAHEIERII